MAQQEQIETSEPLTTGQTVVGPRRRTRSILIGIACLLLMIGWGVVSLRMPFSESNHTLVQAPSNAQISQPVTKPAPAPAVEQGLHPRQVEGHWVLNDTIRREIVIRPDGTATMDVRLDYFSSLIYGREMKMELTWAIKDNVLSHEIISGTPKANVDRLARDFGNSRSYRVIELNDHEMVLESLGSDRERHHWVAVE